MTQTKLREKVIFAVYDIILGKNDGKEYDPPQVLSGIFATKYEEIPLYARDLYIKSLINCENNIALVQPNLKKWTFDRLNFVIQAMFVVAVTERNILGATDRKIVINEAVEFAKKYADNLDYKFVNAVLDKVLI